MQLHQLLADGEAKAAAAEPAADRGVGLPERQEQVLDHVLGDADAGIADADVEPAVLGHLGRDRHGAALRRELTALDSRLSRICFSARSSARRAGSVPLFSTIRRTPPSEAFAVTMRTQSLIVESTEMISSISFCWPASMRDMSRMSLISASSSLPLLLMSSA